MKFQKELWVALLSISLMMTFGFGLGLSSGFSAFLIAVMLVGLQAGALVYLPPKAKKEFAGKDGCFWVGIGYSACIALVLLISVTATVATLSQAVLSDGAANQERARLEKAIDGYIEHGYITKAMKLREELKALPEQKDNPISAAAVRLSNVTGMNSNSVTSMIINIISLLLDIFVVVLAPSHRQKISYHNPENDPPKEKPSEGEKQDDIGVVPSLDEVSLIIEAYQNGKITSLAVRPVRKFLGCSQDKAQDLSKQCKHVCLVPYQNEIFAAREKKKSA